MTVIAAEVRLPDTMMIVMALTIMVILLVTEMTMLVIMTSQLMPRMMTEPIYGNGDSE